MKTSPQILQALHAAEVQRYLDTHPSSVALADEATRHWLYGLPMHWMRDWPAPRPLFVAEARGARLRCVDGHVYDDFCLGDTGAMFGHGPAPVAQALALQAGRGLTAMLPPGTLPDIGRRLAALFGLPRWQVTLSATDANRFVLRWARAVTGRPKLLVFEGCYHGTVDDTLVDRADDGRTLTRASLLGQVQDLAIGTVVVPFNDAAAVEAALAGGDIAAVLTEPALTNCGLVPPLPGFLEAVQAACRRHGTLLVLDETHTLSSGPGGLGRRLGLQPDFLVAGKAVAGGMPCAVYGFTDAVAERMARTKEAAPEGHSGIGTTLSGGLLGLAALQACLAEVMTPAAWARMEAGAARLQAALERVIAARALPWSVTRLGARMELQFCSRAPRDAREAAAAMHAPLERLLHLWLLNRGVLLTPFHDMLLVSPETDDAAIDRVAGLLDRFLAGLAPA